MVGTARNREVWVKTVDRVTKKRARSFRAERDFVAFGIAIAAILMFVSTGAKVLPTAFTSLLGISGAPDPWLTNALILNVALLIFGWRRYRDLQDEIAHRRLAEERARELAETDPLTGCMNRRSLIPEVADKFDTGCHHIAAFVIDLDNFKQVNDAHGHRAGDQALLASVDRIKKVLPQDAILARLGGDEFACIVPCDNNNVLQMDAIADSLIESIRRPFDIENATIMATASVGIATLARDTVRKDAHKSIDQLLHRADIAMYHAKRQGKNRHAWFEATMESELQSRSRLEAAIREGIEHSEFVPFYQKQIDLETGKLTGFEMLARWQSKELGLVSPDVFIPIAEDIGLISDLSELLIAKAFEDAKEWHESLSLSVNISPVQLRDPWFAQKLLRLLMEKNFPAQRLDVEITESCLHENLAAVQTIVGSLRNQGVKISLDDFGTGYASLAQLRSLPFDQIKIDRSFVAGLENTEEDEKLVEAIISMGKSLNLPVTAEGIENEAILAALRRMGKLKGQGFLYGKPIDSAMTRKLLEDADLLVQSNPNNDFSKPTTQANVADPSHAAIAPIRKAG